MTALRNIVRISREGFRARLANSPALPVADAVYGVCLEYRLDPLFLLAMFSHESSMGTRGTAAITNSWGNTRAPTFGGVPVIRNTVPSEARSGSFPVFRNWADGAVSTIARLCSMEYPSSAPYGARQTIEEIFIHPSGLVWAPAGDLNSPDSYLRAVLNYITQYEEKPVSVTSFAEDVQLIPVGNSRPGIPLTGFHAFVVHETDNESPSAGAQMHHDWLVSTGPDASFHFVSDADTSIQLLPLNELGYHIGDGADEPNTDESYFTVAGEICVNSREGFHSACRRMARIAAAVLTHHNMPVNSDTLRTHGSYWSQRNPSVHRGCPRHLKAGDWGLGWSEFRDMVVEEQSKLSGTGTEGVTVNINERGETVLSINFGGVATEVLGVNVVDAGVSVKGADGATYDRSVQGNALGDWNRRGE